MPLGYRDVLNILSALEMMKIHKCVENFCSDYSLGNQLNPERKFRVTVRSSALLCLIILYVVELRAGVEVKVVVMVVYVPHPILLQKTEFDCNICFLKRKQYLSQTDPSVVIVYRELYPNCAV